MIELRFIERMTVEADIAKPFPIKILQFRTGREVRMRLAEKLIVSYEWEDWEDVPFVANPEDL